MNSKQFKYILIPLFHLIALAGLSWETLAGPTTSQTSSESNKSSPSGEQLWSNNCQRCHNLQSPAMFSPAQWQIIVHHMRVRANITGADQRAILEFLKSSSR